MKSIRPALLSSLALSVSLLTTAWLWQHERDNARQDLRAKFDFGLRDITVRISQRINSYEQMLRGVQGFYSGSQHVSRLQFATYVDSLRLGADFAGVQGIGLALIVPAEAIKKHEARIRKEGIPDYQVHPASSLQIHAPIIQAEPSVGRNLIALGYDPYTDPVRRTAMEKSRESGLPTISGKLTFALEKAPDSPPSFVMYAPVFRPGSIRNIVRTRRENTIGWIYAPIRMSELMASLYGDHDPDIEVSVYDGVEPVPAALLHNTNPGEDTNARPRFQAYEYLEIAGHSWTVEARSRPAFENRYSRDESRIIAISGTFMSVLLAVIAWLMASSRSHAIALADAMTKEYRISEERWKFALEGAGDGVWDRDLRTDEVYFSRRCREIFGYDKAELGSHRSEWVKRIHPEDLAQALADTQACIEGSKRNFASEYRLLCKNGSWKWVLSRGHVISYDTDGKPLRLIGTVSDISERKHTEERIRHMAQHDSLTGLPNRALFFDRFRQALAQARRSNRKIALLFVDLNRFKPINDEYGHAIGDQVLQQVANRLRDSVRESDTVGRVGGDEFVILLPTIGHEADVKHVADKVHASLASPLMIEDHQLGISASIGLALFPDHGDDEISLMKAADLAMYRVKQADDKRQNDLYR